MTNAPSGAATAAAIRNWTDDELCRELAARATDGETRVRAERHHLVLAEYDRRSGIIQPSETEVFNRYRNRLQEQRAHC